MGEHVNALDLRLAETRFSVATTACGAETLGVSVRGNVDPVTAPELEQELLDAAQLEARRVVVDLTETTFVDSSAIHALMRGGERLLASGRQFGLVCSNPSIRKVLEIVGVDQTFRIYPTIEHAISSKASSQSSPVPRPATSWPAPADTYA